MAQCKEGQLAFIKKSLRPENIGKVVICQKYIGYYSRGDVVTVNGENWLAPDTDDYWVIYSESGIETQYGKSKIAYIMDSWLTPIDPDLINDEIETKELEEV